MASKTIHIHFGDKVDRSRELAAVAASLAFDFSCSYPDNAAGQAGVVAYRYKGHYWYAWWTKSRAVVVRCDRVEV